MAHSQRYGRTVSASEARLQFDELLESVAKGERITIEDDGVSIARLEPVCFGNKRPTDEIIAELRECRKGRRLDGLSIRDMLEDGRQ